MEFNNTNNYIKENNMADFTNGDTIEPSTFNSSRLGINADLMVEESTVTAEVVTVLPLNFDKNRVRITYPSNRRRKIDMNCE